MLRKFRKRTWARFAVIFAAVLTAVQIVAIAPALANAANPNPNTKAVATVNANGSVSVKVSGTWSWPGQSCEGRYGEGWAVDWWGISASATPANPFSLTNATIVTSPTSTTTGTITPAGSIPIKGDGFFHVSADYNGQVINSPTTCTDTGTGGSAGSTGSWSAMATYPSKAALPPAICVNMYDEHGSEGKPSTSPNDYSAVNDHDNSIQTNAFNPSVGSGYCATPKVVKPPKPGYLEICKKASGTGLDHDVFTFSVQGKTVRVPVGACSPAIKVRSGDVTVTEVSRAGSKLVSVSAFPARRLVSVDLSTRSAVVKVVPGGISTQTIVTFTNKVKPGSGLLKICKVAGAGITVGRDFSYTVGSQSVTVPAGPAPGGYCVIVGKFSFGDQTIAEKIPSGVAVSSITAAPRNRLVSKHLRTGIATVAIGSGVTEVTYTNRAAS